MFGRRDVETLVAGAGPVGLFTGLALERRGVDTLVVDSQWQTAGRSYALALHPRTLGLLGQLGMAEELLTKGHRVDTLAFYDAGERRGELRFSELPGDFPFLLILPQDVLEHSLETRLRRSKARLRWNHRLAQLEVGPNGVSARVDRLVKESMGYATAETGWLIGRSYDVSADYLIGADGHRSAVRKALGIDFEEVADSELFAVFEFRAAGGEMHEARILLDDGAMGVLWPLGGDRYRFSFQLEALEDAELHRAKSRLAVVIGEDRFPHLDERRLHELIAERAPFFDAEIKNVRWSLGIRFERRLAQCFGGGRAWLVGDAAHLAGPVGMHSMNVGIAEAHELAGILAETLHEGASPSLLERWEIGRRSEWRRLLGLERQAEATDAAPEWAASRAAQMVPLIPASGEDLPRLLGQVGIVY